MFQFVIAYSIQNCDQNLDGGKGGKYEANIQYKDSAMVSSAYIDSMSQNAMSTTI